MQQKALYRRSSFFIDVMNVILYTDLFLYHELKERMKTDECIQYYFQKNLPNVEDSPENDTWLIHEFTAKKHQNILEDWIDKDLFFELNASYVYEAYISELYYDLLNEPICNHYIQMTGFAQAIKLLLKDENLRELYFYVPFESTVVFDNLQEAFLGYGANRIKIMTGPKTIKSLPVVDSYVFENIRNVDELLCRPHSLVTEVIIPAYDYNIAEDQTEFEQLVEQITYHRLALEHEDGFYKENYNLSINTIAVPV